MRTATPMRTPWDVPVRLADGPPPPHARRDVRTVGAGVDLPGVAALRITTVVHDGVVHLEGIGPVPCDAPAPRDEGADLATVLGALVDEDGSVPVAVDGTPFTRQVLTALLRVPSGARITYAALAAVVGRPRAVRAVASVMARNRVPLVLPCHRVVPSTGGTGRYGWGDAVKVALLDAERSPSRMAR